jgi:very-short-patch-repair endonuclease
MCFDDLVARQGGIISLAQAVDRGVSARTVQRNARDGTWERLRPAVYLVGGHLLDDRGRVRAAGLWGGVRSTVAGPAAAFWHGMLPEAPDVVDLTVPAAAKPRPQHGILIRRRDLHWIDRVQAEGLWLTGRALTVLETAVALPDGSMFLDRALQKWVRFPTLYRAFCRNLGRTGSSRAGQLITASADRAESEAERMLVALLRDAGITGWVLGHPLGAHRIDLAFPDLRVAIEVDGWAWHVDAERFRADRRKGNAINRARWDLLRFTWHDLDGRPWEVVAEIRDALAAAMIERTGS